MDSDLEGLFSGLSVLEAYKKEREQLFIQSDSDRTRENGFN